MSTRTGTPVSAEVLLASEGGPEVQVADQLKQLAVGAVAEQW